MMEARNLRNMVVAQTPLLGDENTPMHTGPEGGTGFEGATPRHQATFTPNPLATPTRHGNLGPGATPRTDYSGATPLRTPLRDNLSLNSEDALSSVGDTPHGRRHKTSATRSLRAAFENLPKPENNFELLVPEDEDEEAPSVAAREEDAAERDARLKRQREEEERKALARRSQVVQLGLPRPANVEVEKLMEGLSLVKDEDASFASARALIDAEMVKLIQHDAIAFPLPGTMIAGGTRSTYEPPEDELVAQARALVHNELASSLGFSGVSPSEIIEGLIAAASADEFSDDLLWDKQRETLTYDAKTSSWVDPSSLTVEERLAGFEALLQLDRDKMAKEAAKSAKTEKKLGIQLGGYQTRFKALAKRTTDAFEELQRSQIDLDSFIQLHVNEQAVGPRRVEALHREVDTLERRERYLQERYRELSRDKEDSEARIAELEERIMAEAEALNDEVLAQMDASA